MNNEQKFIRRAVLTAAASLLLASPALAAEFTDGDSITHPEAVEELADIGVISGRPDGSFDPNGAASRAEMAKMLSLLLDPEASGFPSAGFTDVSGTWAEMYINHCCSLGLIAGRGDGSFDPDGTVTGTETAKMLLAAAGYDASVFTGAGWDARVNEAARTAGLYTDFTAEPAAPLTRDGAALLLYNGLSLLDNRVSALSRAPTGIAVMPDGSLLITDTFSRTVCQLKDGTLTLYAGMATEATDANGRPFGGYYDAAAGKSTFKLPWAAAPFLDGWAVSDAENNVVRLIQNGRVMTINPQVSGGESASFAYPTGLASAPDGSLYVSDTHNGRICRINPDGTMQAVASGLQDPMGLCWDGGALYIAETGANRIVQLKDGKVATLAGNGEEGYADGSAAAARFSGPKAVTMGLDGALYVSDTGNSAIRVIKDGRVATVMMRDPADEESVYPVSPMGLARQGRFLYVCDAFAGMLLTLLIR
ncbi:MAG: S-layer homology domain-containing protein [Oscillospiraceae bacterium]|nr:S-layer homology domain-containing protein [Oscillospiraceae bacterium]